MASSEMESAIDRTAKLLIKESLTISFAESATAGAATAEFSFAEHAGKFLKGGLICYNAFVKSDVLKVSPELFEKYSPESMEVTEAITRGLKDCIEADIYVGITGLPSPGGSENEEKPVGTMFIYACLQGQELFAEKKVFTGTHREIVSQTVSHTAELLLAYLIRNN